MTRKRRRKKRKMMRERRRNRRTNQRRQTQAVVEAGISRCSGVIAIGDRSWHHPHPRSTSKTSLSSSCLCTMRMRTRITTRSSFEREKSVVRNGCRCSTRRRRKELREGITQGEGTQS